MGKYKEEQPFWQDKLSLLKRVGFIAFASTIALSVPAVSDVASKVSPFGDLGVSAAEAQTNLMNSSANFHTNHDDHYEHWTHSFQNDGDMNVGGPDFDLTGLTYVVKFPDALSHLLEDEYVREYLFGIKTNFGSTQNPFKITGHVIDENGEKITIATDTHKPYDHISINKATNSIEFDFNSFYTANNLKPSINTNISGEYIFENLGFTTPIIVEDSKMLDNGTYEFKSAIVRGKSVDLNNVSNSQSQNLVVDYSTDAEPEVDTRALEALVASASDYDSNDYTEESFAALTTAVDAANKVIGNEEATQEQVNAALVNLNTANDGLVEVKADTGVLEALVLEANAFDAADYKEESFAALTAEIAEAKAVLADETTTQKEVDAALTELQAAIDGLVDADKPQPNPEVDTSKLATLIDDANDFVANDYTSASFAAVTSALEEANVVLGNESATQGQIDSAFTELQEAIDGLVKVKKPEPEQPKVPGDGSNGNVNNGKTNGVEKPINVKSSVNDSRLPNTATNTFSLLLIGSLLSLSGGALVFFRRKKLANI